ncbi:odorant receptor 13a-like [Lasioglossum baleicum]|uniref:odorant receptor 13a-like n=1 Tax=Lasioglossum baleicum TaxID=434251 RepID=UPI003FCD3FD7
MLTALLLLLAVARFDRLMLHLQTTAIEHDLEKLNSELQNTINCMVQDPSLSNAKARLVTYHYSRHVLIRPSAFTIFQIERFERTTMFENVMPEKAMAFVRLSIVLICGWPLLSTTTKAQVLCYRILKVLSASSVLALLLPVLNAAIFHFGDAANFSKAIIIAMACVHGLIQILISSIQHDRWQRLIEHITASLKNAKSYEKNVYQRYVNTYCRFYGLTVMWYYMSAMVVIVGSVFLPQPFPTISKYPFDVDNEPVRTIIFLHQAFVGFQCSATVSVNMFAALLLLFAAARYEIVMIDLRESTSIDALTMCVKKYYSVTRFAKDVTDATQYIVWYTILISSVDLVLCGLNIIGRQPFVVKLQFMTLSWTAMMEVFMCALPADVLINMSTNAVGSVYESTWYDQVLGVQKTILRILVPQAPVIISLKCFMPRLSLEYYCSYISNSVSLFTALRMVVGEDAEFLSSKSTNSSCCIE